jgi:hypothetical protein
MLLEHLSLDVLISLPNLAPGVSEVAEMTIETYDTAGSG